LPLTLSVQPTEYRDRGSDVQKVPSFEDALRGWFGAYL
jgi:hypothetical protein